MKKYLILLLLAFSLSATVKAQQVPLYSAYYFNKFLINPGLAGFDDQYQVYAFYRTQWTSLPGAPVTRGGTFEGSFWKDRSGVGLHVINDNTDIINELH